MKKYWLGMQQEILQTKGAWLVYLLIVIASYIGPDIPDLTFIFRMAVNLIGLAVLVVVYFVGKSQRTARESRIFYFYGVFFLVGCIAAIFRVYR